jgi:hypothetical protein
MSERKPVFLNGSPFWFPLLGLGTLLATSVITHSVGHLPFVFQCLSGLMVVANLGMLMSCRSAFSRWLGRTKYPEIGLLLSVIVSFTSVLNLQDVSHHNIPGLAMFTIATLCLLLACSAMAAMTLLSETYYIEDSEGHMVCKPTPLIVIIVNIGINDLWNDLVQKKSIRSGDRLMQRKLLASYPVRVAEGLEWLAWRSEDIGNQDKATVVFGRDIASARQTAAQILNADPDLIVIAPRVIDGACAIKLDEAAKHQKLRYQAAMEEQERRKQEEKAEMVALQAQICPENSPLILEEDHATRMDRLFYEAIDASYSFASIAKN